MRTQTENRTLPTELSPEDLAEESKKLATAVEEVAKQKDAIAEKTGLWRETKKKMEGYLGHLEGEMNALAEIVDTGIAEREVPCSWLYALPVGYAFLTRDDTAELVTHRKLREEERQTDLLEVLREPTEEQLAGWTVELGLVIDPQQGLPLAEPGADGPVPYYRVFVLPDGGHGKERITARFSEADHRPGSLTGVHVHEETGGTGLPEQVDRGTLLYEDGAEVIRTYRAVLESMLEEKQLEARQSRTSGVDDPPTPIGRGRKAKP